MRVRACATGDRRRAHDRNRFRGHSARVRRARPTTGHIDTAYGLLTQERCPSWLYPVLHGATTIWERWDAITPRGRVNQDGIAMISFNHYALGAVADWLHRVVGGLAPASPGWREICIAPVPGGGLRHASSRLDTPYGLASSSWELGDGTVTVEAIVPPNTTAHVRLPGHVEELESAPARTAGPFPTSRPQRPRPVSHGATPRCVSLRVA